MDVYDSLLIKKDFFKLGRTMSKLIVIVGVTGLQVT